MGMNLISQAIGNVGLSRLAKALGMTHQGLRKIEKAARLPRTEWTGETDYAGIIERVTGGAVSKSALLEWSLLSYASVSRAKEKQERRDQERRSGADRRAESREETA